MSCLFFLSYARDNFDVYLERFYDDLVREVHLLAASQVCVGFRDDQSIPLGAQWGSELAEALRTCQVFIPLCSPAYFRRSWCGKEWQFFRSRLEAYSGHKSQPALIIPVLWVPIAKPPSTLAELQYTQYGVTDQEYKQLGLRNLIRIKRRNYMKFLVGLARTIVQALEEHKLPSAIGAPIFEQIQDAFQEFPPQTVANVSRPQTTVANSMLAQPSNPGDIGPRYAKFFYVVARRSELQNERNLLGSYSDEDALDWRPYFPPAGDPATILAQEAATSEKLTCEHLLFDDKDLIEILERSEAENKIVLLIVDVWTLKLARYRTVMSLYDKRRFRNCIVLITQNEDDETKNQQENLERVVWLTLARHRQSGKGFHYPIKSGDKFKEKVIAALHESRNNIIEFSEVVRKLQGAGPIAPPIIAGPKGT